MTGAVVMVRMCMLSADPEDAARWIVSPRAAAIRVRVSMPIGVVKRPPRTPFSGRCIAFTSARVSPELDIHL